MGLFTVGGGYAMLPFIKAEVSAHNWMGMKELINFLAISESTPGSMSVNMATYIGYKVGGFPGILAATVGVIFPSFAIMLAVAIYYDKFRNNKIVSAVMYGLKAAVVGLIASAIISVGENVFLPNGLASIGTVNFYASAGIFAICSFLNWRKLNPMLIITFSMVAGIAAGFMFNL